jgi:hypothetical protein
MNEALRTLAALAAQQNGAVSRAQAHALGLRAAALRRHVAGGMLVPVVVEVGGRRGYLTRTERRRQERRRNELQLLGKVAYFFTYEDIPGGESYVVRTLRAAVEVAA